MTSSWKPRASSLLASAAAAGFLLALAVFAPRTAMAAGCPSAAVSENGGKHWCFDAGGGKGHVHLWTPGHFNLQGAVTVVYMHGYNNDEAPYPNGRREEGSYIDRAWDMHKLSQQFAASGLNALFIAAEGPIGNKNELKNPGKYAGVRWTSLGSLLNSVQDKGGMVPPGTVTAIGHSAGMFTVHYFFGDARLRHVVALDSMYGDEQGDKRAAWLRKSPDNRLTLVGGIGGQNALMRALSDKIGCTAVEGRPASLASTQISASCLYVNSKTEHMAVVTSGAIIPVMLARSGPSTVTPGTSPSPGGGALTVTQGPKEYSGPKLEIPIPGVEFSNVISQEGSVTFPWLAQYIGGVYQFLISIVGLVAAVVMIVGGFQYLTSAGDKGRIGAAKKRITGALVGMILAFGSYTILYAISPNLVAFDGLKVASVTTELSELGTVFQDGGDVIPQAAEHAVTNIAGGTPQSLCRTVDACRPYCLAACARTLNQEKQTVSVNCDLSIFPQSAPGIIPASQAVDAQQAFQGKPGISAGDGILVSIPVRDGLIRAGAIADREGYRIEVTSGFRTLPKQFDLVCQRIMKADYWRATKPDLAKNLEAGIGSAVAWPGGSLHGAGYAADLQLYKKSGEQVVCAGCCGTQASPKYQEPSATFDRIMTEAGARRYAKEIWHYEFGAPASVQPRCTAGNCPWPPSCK